MGHLAPQVARHPRPAHVAQAIGGQHQVVVRLRLVFVIHQRPHVGRHPRLALGAQVARRQQQHLPPPGIARLVQGISDEILSPGQRPGSQVLLKREMGEAVDPQPPLLQQPAAGVDDGHKCLAPLARQPPVVAAERQKEVTQLAQQHLFVNLAQGPLLHPEGDWLQQAALVARIKHQARQGIAAHAARLVPVAQQHLDALFVQLGPPLRQLGPVAMHQGDHRQQQWVDGQLAHPLVILNRRQQSLSLAGGPPLDGRAAPSGQGHLHGRAPVAHEALHGGAVEIAHGGQEVTLAQAGRALVANDAAGDHVAVFRVAAGKGFDDARHPPPQVGVGHLVQAVQQHCRPARFQCAPEKALRQGDFLSGEVVGQVVQQKARTI